MKRRLIITFSIVVLMTIVIFPAISSIVAGIQKSSKDLQLCRDSLKEARKEADYFKMRWTQDFEKNPLVWDKGHAGTSVTMLHPNFTPGIIDTLK